VTRAELEKRLADEDVWMSASALIEHEGARGIAIRLGETLHRLWQSGDVIVFWTNGDHTILPDEFELVREGDLFDAADKRKPCDHEWHKGRCIKCNKGGL